MPPPSAPIKSRFLIRLACAAALASSPAVVGQQEAPPAPPPVAAGAAAELDGLPVVSVDVQGNTQVPDASVLNLVRTRVGEPFDHVTTQEDYQRIDAVRRFGGVTATVERVEGGVAVTFRVTEQRPVEAVVFRGNVAVPDDALREAVRIEPGEAVDPFRVGIAKQSIAALYAGRNFPLARVDVDLDEANRTGQLVFVVNEGPNVKIRNIDFVGNDSFSEDALKKRIGSKTYIPILRAGTFDPDQVDDDVAALANYYQGKGYFDVKVGRRLAFSPDQRDVQIEFVIDEGPRYQVNAVTFEGNERLTDEQLRDQLRLTEGEPFDNEVVRRDIDRVVEAYSPLGLLYDPTGQSPDTLQVNAVPVFRLEPGSIELRYRINEGRPYRVGEILVRGNSRTQDKVALRELRVAPGDLYDSAELRDAANRLRSVAAFDDVTITPIGDDPDVRDLLVEVQEAQTGFLTFGIGVNSNGGFGGNITYTQRNFDLLDFPERPGELFTGDAFAGAGQTFRASFEPGNEATNGSILFNEPFLLDQPYSLTAEAYVRDRGRLDYDIRRAGGRLSLGRFLDEERVYSVSVTARAEDIKIFDIRDEEVRSFQILDAEGHTTLTSLGLTAQRDTRDNRFVPSAGSQIELSWESFGALGGNDTFQRFIATHQVYYTLATDLRDRRVVLEFANDAGFIAGDAPFYERFYEGGIGSIRGFAFRGVTVRDGPAEDRVGGEFTFTGHVQLGFPLVSEQLRGVAFFDYGTVQEEFDLGDLRTAAGVGVRWAIPIFGEVPVAIDFGFPITSQDEDDTQILSFSLGIAP